MGEPHSLGIVWEELLRRLIARRIILEGRAHWRRALRWVSDLVGGVHLGLWGRRLHAGQCNVPSTATVQRQRPSNRRVSWGRTYILSAPIPRCPALLSGARAAGCAANLELPLKDPGPNAVRLYAVGGDMLAALPHAAKVPFVGQSGRRPLIDAGSGPSLDRPPLAVK